MSRETTSVIAVTLGAIGLIVGVGVLRDDDATPTPTPTTKAQTTTTAVSPETVVCADVQGYRYETGPYEAGRAEVC